MGRLSDRIATAPRTAIESEVTVRTLIAICLVTISCLAAQSKLEMFKLTQPGEHHKQLEPLAGTWNVAVKFKLGGRDVEAAATCESKWVLGARFLEQDYKAQGPGVQLNVRQYLGYDNQKKKFVEIKMDNMETGVLHNEGTISDDGKVITCVGDRTDPMTGKVNKMRTVTTIIDNDRYTAEWFMTSAEGKEDKIVTMTHTRKK